MKRVYTKPMLLKEHFDVETQITGCAFVVKSPSLMQQCAYDVRGLGFFIFGEGWEQCIDQQFKDGSAMYCYHTGANNGFGSA